MFFAATDENGAELWKHGARTPEALLANITDTITDDLDLNTKEEESLLSQVSTIDASLKKTNEKAATQAATGQTGALVKHIEALERSNRIDPDVADKLIADLEDFLTLL